MKRRQEAVDAQRAQLNEEREIRNRKMKEMAEFERQRRETMNNVCLGALFLSCVAWRVTCVRAECVRQKDAGVDKEGVFSSEAQEEKGC